MVGAPTFESMVPHWIRMFRYPHDRCCDVVGWTNDIGCDGAEQHDVAYRARGYRLCVSAHVVRCLSDDGTSLSLGLGSVSGRIAYR